MTAPGIGIVGYAALISLPSGPDEGAWSRVELRAVEIDPQTLLESIPRSSTGQHLYYTQSEATNALYEQLQSALDAADVVAELAADEAWVQEQLCASQEHRPFARGRLCAAIREYHLARWRIAQIEALLLRFATFDAPLHRHSRSVSAAPFSRAA
ncbi:MAG TPA: hypothetical protein VNF68_10415 [Candidatus Baltobacteraceae bacterium]|nr:hypothetical protein [Candidatus Baltobacteraceae bacterium]